MQCLLPYGTAHLEVRLPDAAVAYVPVAAPAYPDAKAAILDALDAPLDASPLDVLARGRRTACVVISDATRPAVGPWVLPPVVAALRGAGIESVEVLIATGTHRAASADECAQLLGDARGIPVRSHDATRNDALDLVGSTPAGTPVWIDRRFVQADVRVVVGVVEPHLMAGYSGGAKSVCPGIAGLDTIRAVHRAPLARACVGPGIVRNNPFRHEVEAAARLVRVDFSVQCCVNRSGALTFAAAGALAASTDRATRFAARHARVTLPDAADVVIVSGGGAPLDRTLYQAAKGWATGAAAVRRGGDVILVAEMNEGIGGPAFAALLEAGLDSHATRSDDTPVATGAWMLQHILQARARARLHVVCSLPAARLRRAGFIAHGSVAAALRATRFDASRSLVVLPHGPFCVPLVHDHLATLEGARVEAGR